MKFLKGRDNLSVTVYVPYNCQNNCSFCSSKLEYLKPLNPLKTLSVLQKVRNSNINEVVFTGGEPMSDIDSLEILINAVDNKDVYINTTLINKNFDKFCSLVNNTDCIKGVNVSRHSASFIEDSLMLNDIVEDKYLQKIKKPIKINVVSKFDETDQVNLNLVKKILKRWSSFSNITVNFRENFNNTTTQELHSLNNKTIEMFNSFAECVRRSYCDVCDTTTYKYNGLLFNYHRGLPVTSIEMGNVTFVNDIIINVSGELVYDWDNKNKDIEDLCNTFNITKIQKEIPMKTKPIETKSKTSSFCGYSPRTFFC